MTKDKFLGAAQVRTWAKIVAAVGVLSLFLFGGMMGVTSTSAQAFFPFGETDAARGQLLQCGVPDPNNPGANDARPCSLCDLFKLIRDVIQNILLPIAGSVAVLNIIIAGIMYILGASIPEGETFSLERAKKTLTFTIGGFILVGMSWLIITTTTTLLGYNAEGSITQIDCDKINSLSNEPKAPNSGN